MPTHPTRPTRPIRPTAWIYLFCGIRNSIRMAFSSSSAPIASLSAATQSSVDATCIIWILIQQIFNLRGICSTEWVQTTPGATCGCGQSCWASELASALFNRTCPCTEILFWAFLGSFFKHVNMSWEVVKWFPRAHAECHRSSIRKTPPEWGLAPPGCAHNKNA